MHSDRVQQFSDAVSDEFQNQANSRASIRHETPTVFVIDGDTSLRQSLETIIRSAGWEARTFASAAAFLSCPRELIPSCLVLDSALPDSCGLELQDRLNRSEKGLHMIFVTEHPDVPVTVRAMRAGAVEVLARPIDDGALLGAIDEAIGRSRAALDEHSRLAALRKDYASLTKREREVMTLIVSGLLNKQAAYQLGISQITVKAHRAQVMRKMEARSFADLVNKAAKLAGAGCETHVSGLVQKDRVSVALTSPKVSGTPWFNSALSAL